MNGKVFAIHLGLAVAALALTSCGKKKEAAPASETQEQAQTEQAASVQEATARAPASELTKASSQGAAAEQARGVFAHAAAGDPEAVYLARCQYCHVQLGPGTITIARRIGEEEALLASRTDLTEDYIKTVVRGGLNTMPAITRVEVSDEELELIAGYLTRNNAENE
jgi:cytochrome c5